MGKINKVQTVLGLPTRESYLMASKQSDNIPATINNPLTGAPKAPAALSEGEYVFSIPSIIALGDGDYHKGLTILDDMHNELKTIGKGMLSTNGE